jgi:hypothetical protein
MGAMDWLRRPFRGGHRGEDHDLRFPGPSFNTPTEMIECAIARYRDWDLSGWVSFHAEDANHRDSWLRGPACTVEIAEYDLNVETTCDVPNLLQKIDGLEPRVVAESRGRGLWRFPGTTPAEMAKVVDAVFRLHYELSPDYAVTAAIQR